ncbi:solute carrier family 23 protein [Enhydrobacter sp.]|jgi:NCS2 family nucleobase:cation symporter-2|uniref:solute carrier family 23 protein n=1 Tax=Enhydrobacter sp. TaxID=1894999 RepID=UPI0026234AE8|nr:solute carrier family 23 protein [Enhydrobacter sp.]WIM13885.1 MAG: hypothetical protein OJF58_004854 [Enhydrobacter sp.]
MQPAHLTYGVDETPPPLRLLMLGVQYAVMIAIYLVLVVIVLRHAHVSQETRVAAIGMALIAAAIGTALQGLPRGPLGSGFLAPPVYSAIYLAPSILAAERGGLPLVFGMTVFAGLVEIAIGLVVHRLRLVFTHVISGLTVFLVGLQLGVVGIGELLDVRHEDLPSFHLHVGVSVLTLGAAIALSIWGRGSAKLLCSLIGLVVGLVAAALIGLITPETVAVVRSAGWTALPWPDVISYRFDPTLVPAFLAAGIAAAVRTVAVVTTCQRINDADWRRPDMGNIRKGIFADGLGCLIGGVLGAPGMNISPSLVGLSSATGATSRAIGFAAAVVLVAIAFSPKAAASFLTIPSEVAGSILVFSASLMIASGMGTMLSRPVQTRATYVIGIATLLALGRNIFPHYFAELSPFMESLTRNSLAVGLGAAILLHLVFLIGTRQTGSTRWSVADESMTAALDFLDRQVRTWKVDADVATRAIKHVGQVFDHLRTSERGARDGLLAVMFNGVDLRLDLSYVGKSAVDLPAGHPTAELRREQLDDEEAAVHFGLLHFLHSIAADRKRVAQHEGRVTIRLWYAA